MLDLRLDDVRVLIEVAERAGFSAAARVLGRSTKQVSRQVARVEQAVGRRLLQRTTHAVSVTVEGRAFLERARRMVAEARDLDAELSNESAWELRRLRVALPTLDFGVSRWVPAFARSRPGVHLHVAVSDPPIDLVGLGYDLQLVATKPTQTSFHVRRLCPLHAVLAAHRDYLAAYGTPEEPADLADHHGLVWVGGSEAGPVWALVGPRGPVEVNVGTAIESTSSGLLLSALEAGQGIGVCGARYLAEQGSERGLVRVLPSHDFVEGALYAVFPGPGRRSSLVGAFIERAVEAVEDWYGAA